MITVSGATIFTTDDLYRFERLMSQYKLAIRAQMKRNKQWTTGRTWNSIEPVVNATATSIQCNLESSNPIVLNTLETGRKAGKVPFDFAETIYQWSIDKGLSFSSDKERWQFANAVKWKTYNEGNKMFREGVTKTVFRNLEPTYQKKILQEIDKIATTKITTILDSFKP